MLGLLRSLQQLCVRARSARRPRTNPTRSLRTRGPTWRTTLSKRNANLLYFRCVLCQLQDTTIKGHSSRLSRVKEDMETDLKETSEEGSSHSTTTSNEDEEDDFFSSITQPQESRSHRSLKSKAHNLKIWLEAGSKEVLADVVFLELLQITKMSYDYESYTEPLSDTGNMEFSDKSIRMGFIRKVYMILMGQLTVTFGIVAALVFSTDAKDFLSKNPALFYVALVGTLVCIIALSCCGNLRRRTPHNYIFLGIFTMCEAFLLGVAASTFDTIEILTAVGITLVITLSLTIFAFQTKYDFTTCGMFVLVSLVVLLLFGILTAIWPSYVLNMVYSCLGALLFSFYLVYDTQLLIGGNHKLSVSPEEYVFGALTLYLDIVNIFMYILSIVGNRN